MTKYLLLILFLSHSILKAQLNADSLKSWHRSFNYNEKVDVTVNSKFLLVGESLLFNIQCSNSSTGYISDLSAIAYIELVNEEAIPIFQTRVELKNGYGSGDFFLPSTLRTGNYTLIAYTNWMRNFSIDGFYTSNITIINPFKKPDYAFTKNKQEVIIEFFPEGGNILAGTLNTIGYIISGGLQNNTSYTIKIIDDSGNVVTESTSTNEGTGTINLLPFSKGEYKAIVSNSSHSFIANLPSIKEDGIGIHVNIAKKFINVHLLNRATENTRSVMLVVQHQGSYVYKSNILFESDSFKIKIDNNLLPSGLSRIAVLDSANQVKCERTIFIRPDFQKQPDVSLDKINYKNREKVSLKINAKDKNSPAIVTVNVRKIDKYINKNDFSGNSIDYRMTDQYIDLLCLLAITKSKPYYRSVLNDNKGKIYIPEVRGVTISGMVTNSTNIPIANELVYLSIPSKNYLFLVSKTDSLGHFYFTTNRVKFNTSSIIQLAPESKNKYQIKLNSEFLNDYQAFTPTPIILDSSISVLIKERSIFGQLENVYYSIKQDSAIANATEDRFYGIPDKIYSLDKYVRFPSLDDVFIEYIPEISLRKNGEQFNIKVVNYKTGTVFNEDPLILLDGIPIFDHNNVIELNPLLIDKIEIIKRRYFYGPLDLNGIISLETYKGDGMNISSKDYNIKEIIGIQPQKDYYQPNYEKEDLTRIPDFRIQLYWEPSLLINNNQASLVEFYTSDVDGDFEISIDGLDLDGNRIAYKTVISVK